MEIAFRAALLAWLRDDPALVGALNAIAEEAPSRTALPWLAIAASASADWGTKQLAGREIRVALELHYRGDDPLAEASLIAAVEQRVEALPPDQPGLRIVNLMFLRSRAEQRGESRRAMLIEYRARILAA